VPCVAALSNHRLWFHRRRDINLDIHKTSANVMDLKLTLSALLVKNDMSFHWDIKLKRWWLVKEKPARQKWQSRFFAAPNLEMAKEAAIVYLESLSLDTAPLK
jgi:hypothetical protein